MISSYKENLFIDFSGWFVKLADYADKTTDDSGLPKLELLLQTGTVIRGSIIGYDKTKQEKLVMVLELSSFDQKSKITLVPAAQIVALTFIDADETLKLFVNHSIVSTLELKRAAKSVEEDVQKNTGEKIKVILDTDSLAENHRSLILDTVTVLPSVFDSLTEDELGKKAIKENIETIKISIGESNKVSLDKKQLHIIIIPVHEFANKQKERIKREIEIIL